jgi:hypothetical protein
MLLLVDKDEGHATQSRSCLAAGARPTFPSGFGVASQPTIQVSNHLVCNGWARDSVPSVERREVLFPTIVSPIPNKPNRL